MLLYRVHKGRGACYPSGPKLNQTDSDFGKSTGVQFVGDRLGGGGGPEPPHAARTRRRDHSSRGPLRDRRRRVRAKLTPEGREAFHEHVAALRLIVASADLLLAPAGARTVWAGPGSHAPGFRSRAPRWRELSVMGPKQLWSARHRGPPSDSLPSRQSAQSSHAPWSTISCSATRIGTRRLRFLIAFSSSLSLNGITAPQLSQTRW